SVHNIEIKIPKVARKLLKWIESPNIAKELSKEKLARIGERVVRDYNIDKSSRSEWETQVEKALKCAKQVVEAKSFPWPGAANVKYPLVTTAAIQFHARSYPEIVKGNEVVKARTVGEDPDGRKQARAD